jgi:hypothetical protein
MSEKYRFSVISVKDKNKNEMFDVRCLHCMYLFTPLEDKYMKKIANRIVLSLTGEVEKMLKVELTPVPILPGMKGGPYKPTFETLPCSTKEKLVSALFSEYPNQLGDFTDCAAKRCRNMYNIYHKNKLLTRIYRTDTNPNFIFNEIKKVIENYNKYYVNDFIFLKDLVVKTDLGQDITHHVLPNLNFLDRYKM